MAESLTCFLLPSHLHVKATLREQLSATDKGLTQVAKQLAQASTNAAATGALKMAEEAVAAGDKFVVRKPGVGRLSPSLLVRRRWRGPCSEGWVL